MTKEELAHQVYTCASCGYCRFGCVVYQETGLERNTVRGRMLLLKKVLEGKMPLSKDIVDSIYMCAQCQNCNVNCPTGIDFVEMSEALRDELFRQGNIPDSAKMVAEVLTTYGNPYAQAADEKGAWLPPKYREPKKSPNLFFVSCTSAYPLNRVAKSILKVLETVEYDFTVLGGEEYCCGNPLIRLGEHEKSNEMMKKNVENFKKLGVKRIFTACPGCFRTLLHCYPPDFRVQHITQFLLDLVQEGKLKFKEFKKKIVYFDGCDLGRHCGIYEEPRELLKAIPGVELVEFEYNRENAPCCGGPLLGGAPDLAKKIAERTLREAAELGVDTMVTSCGTCFLTFMEAAKVSGIQVQIRDLPMLLPSLVKKGE